jgi:hemerythrin
MDWKAEYSIGIPEIDEQHKQLFACIDRLDTAATDEDRNLAVYYVMEELKDYVRIHFAVEEIVMRLFDYPGLEAHAAEHREFAAQLEAFEKSELKAHVHAEASQYLRKWLLHHIQGTDKRYAAHLGKG